VTYDFDAALAALLRVLPNQDERDSMAEVIYAHLHERCICTRCASPLLDNFCICPACGFDTAS
jgi:hypothetical protein